MAHAEYDAIIVGGGLAGLRCAQGLRDAGASFLLLEAENCVGGRVRTDEFDGFLLDRGFQVLLTAYPEAARTLDFPQLDLQPFLPGALVRVGKGFHTVADPWRRPSSALQTLFAPIGSFSDKLRIAALRRRACRGSLAELFARREESTRDYLRRFGFSEPIVGRFFRPFFGGVFLEPELRTSSRMLEFVFRMFAEGRAALPGAGMQAIPDQLAAGLPPETTRLESQVTSLEQQGVRLATGEPIRARAVVLATAGDRVAEWVPDLPPVESRSVTCLYFAAERSPVKEPILVLNGESEGVVNNLCVPSDVNPRCAPPGAALVSATVLGSPALSDSELTERVLGQLGEWFGSQVDGWRHLRTYRIDHALPETGPRGLAEPSRAVRLRPGLYVCGDHRETPSIEGALVSGRRAADDVLEDLARPSLRQERKQS